jgi:hypothetical protein
MINILIIGPEQCGTTRVFNLVSQVFKIKKYKVLSGWDLELKNYNNYDVLISKIHICNLNKLKNFDYIIFPIRDLRDSAISTKKRYKKKNNLITSAKDNIKIVNSINSVNNILFKYENYNKYYIVNFCKKLGIFLNNEELIYIILYLDYLHNSNDLISNDINNKTKYNNLQYNETLLTKSHNTSGGKIGKYIEKKYQKEDFLSENDIKTFLDNYKYLEYENNLRLIKSNLLL